LTKKDFHKARKEVQGVEQPNSTSQKTIAQFLKHKNQQIDTSLYIAEILKGNTVYLSKAITLIESNSQKHKKAANTIINACLPYANKAIRIGITGVPGVGKSTFIENLGKLITKSNKKVAILAIDPSSSISKGSILGDKTRMETLVRSDKAYIRPSAAGKTLGGVAQKTRETSILCEAAGFDYILIETVGVGQSETTVSQMVDFFLLLKLAGAGDELQGIKRGIIEMADLIVINKADGDNINQSKLSRIAFSNALHLFPPKTNAWIPKVITASGLNNKGIGETWQIINEYLKQTKANHSFDKNRNKQNEYWFEMTINDGLKQFIFQNKTLNKLYLNELNLVKNNKKTPYAAANSLLLALKKLS
jgi:LAO/AO transport system kinase